jgi:hypothetical protein
LSFLAVISNGQSAQTEQRDLNDYDKISFVVSATENPYPTIAKVRSFVWRHWTERTLGYAEMRLYSKEGEPSKSFIFIESDKTGAWRVAVRIERELHDRRLVGDPKRTGEIIRQTNSYEAHTVEQVKSKYKNASMSKKDFLLKFKDNNGNILAEL